jgi:hypothetical protein
VRIAGRDIPISVPMWFGVLGAPTAWTVQFVMGIAFELAQCNASGRVWQLPVDGWALAATVVAAVVAVLAGLSAIAVFQATRDAGDEPPASRIHFLSVIGMTITPLFLAIILMGGLGAVHLPNCHQS